MKRSPEKTIVLVGAGNAHLQVARMWPMKGLANVRLVLVNDTWEVPYSALIPACLSGEISPSKALLDLVKICARTKTEFVKDTVQAVDLKAKKVILENRAPLMFDVVSLNVGSRPHIPVDSEVQKYGISTKPLGRLMERIAFIKQELIHRPRPFRWVVVGGGPGGCEIAAALASAFRHQTGVTVRLLHSEPSLASGHSLKASQLFQKTFLEQGVQVLVSHRVVRADSTHLHSENGEKFAYDAFIWAVGAEPLPWLKRVSPHLDQKGFLKVRKTLQIEGFEDGFAAGDCISLEGYASLPKAGVFSVRQASVLLKNLKSRLTGRPLLPYFPQRRALALFNTSDGKAIMSYGKLVSKGAWISRWKHYIDERWMEKFRSIPSMTSDVEDSMPCGGCAAKVPYEALNDVLRRLDISSHPDILVGVKDAEDVSLQRLPPGKIMAQTTDFFRAFLDDPFLVGKIAAANALSDLYAKNATPFSVLAQIVVPFGKISYQQELLFQVLSGAVSLFEKEGVHLVGGHSAQGPELAVGFTATGFLDESDLFRKRDLKRGDLLVLTKRLGSGALLAAHMRGQCEAAWFSELIEGLTATNGTASRSLAKEGVKAATDVTGFGLAGHLLEMLDGGSLGAMLWVDSLPTYRGFDEVTRQGVLSTLFPHNAKFEAQIDSCGQPAPEVLFDPQTSGGLLCGIAEKRAEALLRALHSAGVEACVIGKVVDRKDSQSRMITLSKK